MFESFFGCSTFYGRPNVARQTDACLVTVGAVGTITAVSVMVVLL